MGIKPKVKKKSYSTIASKVQRYREKIDRRYPLLAIYSGSLRSYTFEPSIRWPKREPV